MGRRETVWVRTCAYVWMTANYGMVVANWTQVFRKSNKCSYLLSYLSSSHIFSFKIFHLCFVCLCVYVWQCVACTYHSTHVAFRGQLQKPVPSFHLVSSINLTHIVELVQQAPLPAEPSCQSVFSFFSPRIQVSKWHALSECHLHITAMT